MLPPCGGPQFHQRYLANPANDSRKRLGLEAARRRLGIGTGGILRQLDPCDRSPVRIVPADPVPPLPPFADRRGKSPFDDRKVIFGHRPVTKLPGQAGRGGPGLGKNDCPGDWQVEPAHHPGERPASEIALEPDHQAVTAAGRVGRRQPGRLIEYDQLRIFVQNLKFLSRSAKRLSLLPSHACPSTSRHSCQPIASPP